MTTRSNSASMLDETYGRIAEVIKKAIDGITIDATIINAKVAPEDREVVYNIIKAVSLTCAPPNSQGSVTSPYNIEPMKSSGSEREYAVAVSVETELIAITRLVDITRAVHPGVINIFVKPNVADKRHPATVTVHIVCNAQGSKIDVIYTFSSRPRGSYTAALASALDFANGTDDDLATRTPTSNDGSATTANGHAPPFKKRKRGPGDVDMSD
jgi:hypothetical protein